MTNPKIQTYITPEDTVTPQLSGEDYKDWVSLAEPIWAQPPYHEYMNPEVRIAAYGAKLGRAYAAVCFACVQGSKRKIGYVIGYPISRGELRQISSGVTRLDSLHEGVRTVYYVDAVGVLPEFEGQGIGFELMVRIARIAKQFGFSQCALRTEKEELKRICDKLGFERTGIFDGSYTSREWLVRSFAEEGELVY